MAKGQVRIDEMYAFVMTDPADNTEGIIGFYTADGWMPMVGADTGRVESLVPKAQAIATAMEVPVRVLRFTVREELMELSP
jgi:hypothetical protein